MPVKTVVKTVLSLLMGLVMVSAGVLLVLVLWDMHRLPQYLGIGVLGWLTQWFMSRYSAPRRRHVQVLFYSALLSVSLGVGAFKLLVFGEYWGRNRTSEIEGAVAAVLFVACGSAALWSYLHLRRLAPAN